MTSITPLPARPRGQLGAVFFVDGGLLAVDLATGSASLHGSDGALRWSSPLGRIVSAIVAPDDGGPCVLVVGDGRAGEVIWLERAGGAILGRATIDEAAEVVRWGAAVLVRLRAERLVGGAVVKRAQTELVRFEKAGTAPTSMSLPLGVSRIGASGDLLVAELPAERRVQAFDSTAKMVFERAGQLLAVGPRAVVGRDGGAVWVRGPGGEAERLGTDLLSPDAGYLAGLRDEVLFVCDPLQSEARAIDVLGTPALRWARTLTAAKRPRAALAPACTEQGVWVTDGAGVLHVLSPIDGQVLATGGKVSSPLFGAPAVAPDRDAVAWVEGGRLFAFELSEQAARPPRPRRSPTSKPTSAPATPEPAPETAPLAALPVAEDALRARFELRFRQLVASPRLSVEVARAETQIAGSTRARRGEIAFRWLSREGPPRGGELRWSSLGLGAGAVFDAATMAPSAEISPRAVPATVRWFEDHPASGDGTGILEDGTRLYGYDNGSWYPLAVDLRGYLSLSLAAPGLLRVALLAAPAECEIASLSAARRFAAQRKKLAASTLRDARALFADVDLSSVESLLDAIASERLIAKAEGQRARLVPERSRRAP